MSEGAMVLGKILDEQSIGAFRDLDPVLFEGDEKETTLFTYIRTHLRQYQQLPSVEVAYNESGVQPIVDTDALDYYLDRLEDRYLYNQLRPIYGEVREMMNNREVREAIERMRDASVLANGLARSSPLVDMASLSHRMREQFDEGLRRGESVGVPTGYDEIDQRMLGHQNGDLNFIVARMGVGKTYTLLRGVRAAVEAQAHTMVITMEMPDYQLGQRLAFLDTGIDTKHMRNFRMSMHNVGIYRNFLDRMGAWRNLQMFNGNMAGTVEQIEALVHQHLPDIIFIDGAYLLKSSYESRYNVDRNQNVAYVADALKQLSIAVNRPIVATTQFNRSAGKGGRQGSLENLGFTDAIAQHSSYVWALVYSKNGPDKRVIRGMKAREGGDGDLEINFKFKPKNFEPIGWIVDDDDESEAQGRNRRNPNTQPVTTGYMA